MEIDWDKAIEHLGEDVEWEDSADLSRLSIEKLRAEHSPIRRDRSRGYLRLTGAGVREHSASVDGVAESLRNFQRLVLATGLGIEGFKTLQGQPPLHVVEKTRLDMDASPIPGSLVLQLSPTMHPSEEISPSGQVDLLEKSEDQLVDLAVRDAFRLLKLGKELSGSSDDMGFIDSVREAGPRVATTLRDFANGMAKFELEPSVSWVQPRRPRITTSINSEELHRIGEAITTFSVGVEFLVIRGTLRTVSDLGSWRLEVDKGRIIKVNAEKISATDTENLHVGQTVEIEMQVTEEDSPVSGIKTVYDAQAVRALSP